MAWKTSPFASGTVNTGGVAAGSDTIPTTAAAANWVGRFIFFEPGQTWVDAGVVVSVVVGVSVTIDKRLRGPLLAGDSIVLGEDAEAGEAAGDYSEDSNSNQRGYQQKSQISVTGTGVIGFVGIKTDTFDVAQSTTSGPWLLEAGTGRQCLGLSAMVFANRSGGSSGVDGNEIIAIGNNGTLWAINTVFHSIQDTIMRMTGEGQMWLENIINIGMTVTELRGFVWWDTVFLEGRELAADIVKVDLPGATITASQMNLSGITMKNMNGFGSINTASKTDQIDVANTIFLNPSPRIVRVELGRVWEFLNCIFGPGLSTTTVTFAGANAGSVQDVLAVTYDVVDLSGTQILSEPLYVHSTGGADTLTSWQRATSGPNLYFTRTIREEITNPGGVWTSSTFSGFFVKCGPFGFQPIILPITDARVAETLTGLLSFAVDPFQTSPNYTTAITSGGNTSFGHIPSSQTNPMTVVAYDGGSAALPGAFGATVTCGTATGTLIEYIGDEVSGYLVVENRNAVAFPDNTAITISGSTFNGLSDTVTFNEEYSWSVDGGGTESLQTVYNYVQALTWGGIQVEAQKWFNSDNGGYLITPVDGSVWRTKRNTTRNGGEGVWLSRMAGGQISTMESDSGVVFNYPSTVTVEVQVLDDDDGSPIQDANVHLVLTSDYTTVVLSGATNASGIVSVSWPYSVDQAVEGWARQMDLLGNDYHQNNLGGTITASGLSIQTRLRRITP